jgi:hypothetical protein
MRSKNFGKKSLKFEARIYGVYNGISKAWNFEFHSNAFCFSRNLKIQNSNIGMNIPPKKCKGSYAYVLSIGEGSENRPFWILGRDLKSGLRSGSQIPDPSPPHRPA